MLTAIKAEKCDTLQNFINAIIEGSISFNPVPFTIDWGNSRGQGKRVKGMVMGGAGNAPSGIKTYYNYFAGLPDYEELKTQGSLKAVGKEGLYLKARSFGLKHQAALFFSHENYKKAYELSLIGE